MSDERQIITVQLVLDDKVLSGGLNRTQRSASNMGKAIKDAFLFDPNPLIKKLERVNTVLVTMKLQSDIIARNMERIARLNAQTISTANRVQNSQSNSNSGSPNTQRPTISRGGEVYNSRDRDERGRFISAEQGNLRRQKAYEDFLDREAAEQARLAKLRKQRAALDAERRIQSIIVAEDKGFYSTQKSRTVQPRTTPELKSHLDNLKRMTEESNKFGQMAGNKFSDGFKKQLTAFGQESRGYFEKIFAANFLADVAGQAFNGLFSVLRSGTIDTVKYAARTQELGIVMESLAKVNDISAASMRQQEVETKRLNITTQDTRETIAKFVNLGFDIKQISPLSRVAQDLAVISSKNSSEELEALIRAIQTLDVRNLRSAGVFLTVDEVMEKVAATTGRTRDSFTTLEKQQAVLNAILQYGTKVAGTYDASMESVSKRMRSLDRLFYEAQNAMGNAYIPTMEVVVDTLGAVLKSVSQYPDIFHRATTFVTGLGIALIALKTDAISGLIASLAGTKGSIVEFFKGGNIPGKIQMNKLVLEELQAERLILKTKAEQTTLDFETLAKQKAITQEKLNQANLARIQANRNLAQNEVDIDSTKRGSLADRLSGIIGKAALVGAILYAIKGVYDSIKEIANAPEELVSIDVNSAFKKQKDLEEIQQKIVNFKNIENDEQLKGIKNDAARLELAKSLSVESQAKLGLLSQEIKLQGDLSEVLSSQEDRIKEKIQNDKNLAASNFISAVNNLELTKKKSEEEEKRFQKLEEIRKRQGYTQLELQKDYQNYGAAIFRAIAANTSPESGITELFGGSALFDYEPSRIRNVENNKKIEESNATVVSAVKDIQSLAITYQTSADKILETRFFDPKNTEQDLESLRKLREEFRKTSEQINKSTADIIAATPQERFDELVKKFKASQNNAFKFQSEFLSNKRKADIALGRTPYTYEQESAILERALYNDARKFTSDPNNQKSLSSSIAQSLDDSFLDLSRREKIKRIEEVKNSLASTDAAGSAILGEFDIKDKEQRKQKIVDDLNNYLNQINDAYENARESVDKYFSNDKGEVDKVLKTDLLQEEESRLKRIARITYDLYGKSVIPESLKNNVKAQKEFLTEKEKELKLQDDITAAKLRLKQLGQGENKELARLNKEIKLQEDIISAKLRIEELQKGENKELQNLNRQIKVQEGILNFKKQQMDIEDEINILKTTSTLPVVNSELLSQKAILETIIERKKAEQQLTSDIAVEIQKRKNLNPVQEFNRIGANVFLDRQRSEASSREDALKSLFEFGIASGNTSLFENNPLIDEAVAQSNKLDELNKKGGIQAVKIDKTNEILSKTQQITDYGNSILSAIGNGMNTFSSQMTSGFTSLENALKTTQNFYNPNTFTTNDSGYGNSTTVTGRKSNLDQRLVKLAYSHLRGKGLTDVGARAVLSESIREGGISYDHYLGSHNDPKGGGFNIGAFSFHNKGRFGTGGRADRFVKILNSLGVPYKIVNGIPVFEKNDQNFLKSIDAALLEVNQDNPQTLRTLMSTNNIQRAFGQGGTYGTVRYAKNSYLSTGGRIITPPKDGVFGHGENRKAFEKLIPILGHPNLNANQAVESSQVVQNIQQKQVEQKLAARNQKLQEEENRIREEKLNKEKANALTTSFNYYGGTSLTELNKEQQDALTRFFGEETKRKSSRTESNLDFQLRYGNIGEVNKRLSELSSDRGVSYSQNLTKRGFEGLQELKDDVVEARKELAGLLSTDSIQQKEEFLKFEKDKVDAYTASVRESIRLSNEEHYRKTENVSVFNKLLTDFNNSQRNDAIALDDETTNLEIRKQALRDKGSLTYQNLLKRELVERDKSRQSLEEEIDSQKRYNEEYLGSVQHRFDVERKLYSERQKAHSDTINRIMEMESALGTHQEGILDRLKLKQLEILTSREKEYEDTITRQLELEESISRKNDDFTITGVQQQRTKLLEIINEQKSYQDQIGDLFADTFKTAQDGLGMLVDKMTKKMGVFGNIFGNFIKASLSRPLSKLFQVITDKVFPRDSILGQVGGIDTKQTAEKAATNSLNEFTIAVGTATAYLNALPQGAGSAISGLSVAGQSFAGGGSLLLQAASITAQGASQLFNKGGIQNMLSGGTRAIHGDISSRQQSLSGIGSNFSNLINTPITSGNSTTSSPMGNPDVGAIPGRGQGRSIGETPVPKGRGILKSIGAALPAIGGSLGASLGGQSTAGSILGTVGGTAAGLLGGIATGALSAGTLFGGVFGAGGALAIGGLSAAMSATVVLAPIAAAFLIGSFFLGRNKRRREEEKIRTKFKEDALGQLKDLLIQVKTDKIDGDTAITQATDIRKQYIEQANQLKDKKTRNIALKDVSSLDSVISQIKTAAISQKNRKETNLALVPTYAHGGIADSQLVRVSRGEELIFPSSGKKYKVPGQFDAKDDVLMNVPIGTIIRNPKQQHYAAIDGYANGSYGVGVSPAVAPVVLQPKVYVNNIIVLSESEAAKFGSLIPGAIIEGKVITQINENGESGIVAALNRASR